MKLKFAAVLLGVALAACASPARAADEPTTKPAVPGAVALRKPTAQVDQTYREEFAKARDPDAKAVLARKILKAGTDAEKPETKYALLSKAIQIAIQGGDAPTGADAVDRIDAAWQVDAIKLRAETLMKTARFLRSPEDQLGLVKLARPTIDKAIAEKKFDLAKELSDAAAAAAQRGNDAALAKEMTARGAEIVERRTAESRAKYAMGAIKAKPDDPTLNATVGRYECLTEDRWPEGLAKLAKGNDAPLKALAAKELAEDAGTDAKVAAADGWWDLSRKEVGLARKHMQLHAASIYMNSLASLEGPARQRVEKRLAELTDQSAGKAAAPPPQPTSPPPAMPSTPPVLVRNLTQAVEGQQIVQSVIHDFPDVIKDVKVATLLSFHEGTQLTHGEGGSRPMNGAYSPSPTYSTSGAFLYWGLADQWKPGRYLVVYRVQMMSPATAPGNVFQTDVYSSGAIGRHQVTSTEVPPGEWRTIPMIVTVDKPLRGEYRIYTAQMRTVALDRIYVYAIQ